MRVSHLGVDQQGPAHVGRVVDEALLHVKDRGLVLEQRPGSRGGAGSKRAVAGSAGGARSVPKVDSTRVASVPSAITRHGVTMVPRRPLGQQVAAGEDSRAMGRPRQ